MRNLPFKEKFDVIFSAFDSVNYLLTIEDFRKMLTDVKSVLEDEGIFTFDVSLEPNSLNNAEFLNREGIHNKIKYKQISNYNSEEKIHYNIFNLELEDGTLLNEEHKQKIFSMEELNKIFGETGFFVMEALDSFSFEDVTIYSERAQFVLKKESV